eukprot:scaffold99044_cov72-Phaeocystis_antarctica.AAC.1
MRPSSRRGASCERRPCFSLASHLNTLLRYTLYACPALGVRRCACLSLHLGAAQLWVTAMWVLVAQSRGTNTQLDAGVSHSLFMCRVQLWAKVLAPVCWRKPVRRRLDDFSQDTARVQGCQDTGG